MKIKNLTLFIAILSMTNLSLAQDAKSQLMIPGAPQSVPGQCHALVNVPAKLVTITKQIPRKDASEELKLIPAKYEWVEKQVPITEEEKTVEIIPATYKTIEEKIIVEPERKEYEIVPAKYEKIIERVEIKPAMRVWRKSSTGATSLTGEVMRLIEVPAQYATITKEKMVTGPQVREIVIPAVYATFKKKIIDKPARTREVIIPAEYKTIRIKQLVTEAKELRKPIKAVMQNITSYEINQPAKLKWQRVPCSKDLNNANIIAIQKALKSRGYDIVADGKFGKSSIKALEKFQEKNGLAKGALTLETMKALGIHIE